MEKGTTYLSQTHYAEEVLRTDNFWNAIPRLTPMQPNTHFNKDDCDKNPAPDFHRHIRGIVLAAEHVLCYLRGTWNQTILYSRDCHTNPNFLWGWVDTDWVGDTDTRRSHTRYILMMNGGPNSLKSRRQDNVSLSTSEAEFVSASLAGQEAIYLRETLTNLGFSQTTPERARAETGGADQWVLKRRELPGFAMVNEKKRLHPWDTQH